MSNPVYLCPSPTGDVVVLDGPEGRHAATVKRTRVGEVVDLVDGRGTRVTGNLDYDEDADLSPNGQWIAIDSGRGQEMPNRVHLILRAERMVEPA